MSAQSHAPLSVRVVATSCALVGVISITVLAGWALNVPTLKSLLPSLAPMKANTAVCLGLLAMAIWFCRTALSRRRNRWLVWILTGLVILTASVTAAEYAFQWDAGIDQLLFADPGHLTTAYPPGRLAPATAACLLFLSGALLLLNSWPRTSHGLIVSTVLVTLICLVGYVYGLPTMYGPGLYTSVALNTIVCLLALCTGLMACRPGRGLTGLLGHPSLHGTYPQFLLGGAVLLPLLLGSLALHVQRIGNYGSEFTFSLFSALLIIFSVALVWVTEGERQRVEGRRLITSNALSESEGRLRLALDSAAIGIWESSPLTGKRQWDERSRAIFGFPPQLELDGAVILSCIHPEDRDLIRRTVSEYVDPAGSGRFDVEHRVYCWGDGNLRYVYAQGRTIFEGIGPTRRAVRSVGTLQDITGLKQGERELRRLNQELEQFAYAAAHDLQEPLRNVCLATQLLAERYKGRFDSAADKLLQTAVDSPARMQDMVKDLLAYSRALDNGENSMPFADSNAVLAGAITNLQTSIEEKQAEISYEVLPAVRMRESHLLQVLQNLIGNSLKYSGDEAPQIRIYSEIRNGLLTFLVKDNGMGIPAEFHERAFLVFKRLHGTNLPGTGIGLALCKRVVEYYGGRIWIESEGHGGATFLFTPPLASEKIKV